MPAEAERKRCASPVLRDRQRQRRARARRRVGARARTSASRETATAMRARRRRAASCSSASARAMRRRARRRVHARCQPTPWIACGWSPKLRASACVAAAEAQPRVARSGSNRGRADSTACGAHVAGDARSAGVGRSTSMPRARERRDRAADVGQRSRRRAAPRDERSTASAGHTRRVEALAAPAAPSPAPWRATPARGRPSCRCRSRSRPT